MDIAGPRDAGAFWSKRRVVVTGGAGFLGSFVVEKLRERGCREIAIPRRREYDLTEMEAAERLLRETRPHVIIHLAARVGGIGANRANPGLFFYENISLGVNMLEAARRQGVEKFVQIGTVCSYPKFSPVPFREEDLWNGYPEETNAPYGIAKKALLVMGQGYRTQYGLRSIFLMPVNLYGPRDNFDLESGHVIPALIRKCIEAQAAGARELPVWGTGAASREFLYVEDAAEGICLAAERYDEPDPVNLGAGSEIKIRDLVNLIVEMTGLQAEVRWDASKPDGQPRRCLDTTKAKERFGFQARTPLEEGLRRTIDWCRQHSPLVTRERSHV